MQETKIRNRFTGKDDRFLVRPESSDSKAIIEVYQKNVYQKKMLNLTIEPGDRWLDLGANVGAFTVFASAVAQRVLAIEAEQQNYLLTKRNTELNERKNVKIIRAAVVPESHKGDTARLFVNKNPNHFWMHSLFKAKPNCKATNVRAIRFSDALKEDNSDCVKMDIEGAEIPILKELPRFETVNKLVLEWSFDKDKRLETARKAIDHLKSCFSKVHHPKLPDTEYWGFYPPAIMIWCRK